MKLWGIRVDAIKGYELREKLGAGGFGAVYRAFQPLLEREVAIKVILPEHANQPEFIRAFEAEAQLVARLEHPHIVPLFDYWRDPDGAYLVMRLVRGGSLTHLLKSGPIDVERVGKWLDQLSGALYVAHRAGVIHRDIKPDNVLVDDDDNVYLTDFGIARRVDQSQADVDGDEGISGSIAYVSPDALRGEAARPQTDIYSMGILVWELLVGKHPFDGHTPSQMIMAHLTESVPDIMAELPDAPFDLNEILQTATAKDASERYTDIREFAHAFRGAITPQASFVMDEVDPSLLFNPYKGLRPFSEADAMDFFGRETLIEHLVLQLETSRFLAVVGASGAGKSSVVHAGVIPTLRRGAVSRSDEWYIVTMTPGEHPIQTLAEALISVANVPGAKIHEQLASGEARALDWVVNTLVTNTELLLVIDQFEEIFTLVQDESERVHFLDLLAVAAQAKETRLRILITLRADFMDRPLHYPAFADVLRQHIEYVIPMSASELEMAITAPALQAGLRVDGNLVAQMVSDIQAEPGALPLLQYALYEVCERRDGRFMMLGAYQALGGIGGALAKRADEVYDALSTQDQSIAQQALLRLVTLGEGVEDTRRRVSLRELNETTRDKQALQRVLNAFGAARLLTFDTEPGTREPLLEVAHEALIREWARLREWLNASRDDIRLQRQLAAAAQDWEKNNRDESYLLTGGRLAQFEEWQAQTQFLLSPGDQAYLQASLSLHEEKRRLDEARKAREDRQRDNLRRMVMALGVFLLVALGASGLAFNRSQVASDNAATATNALGQSEFNAQTSIANAMTATNAQGQADFNAQTAVANAMTATNALGLADVNAQSALTQAARADQNAATSEANFRQALDTQLRFLADLAEQQVVRGDGRMALHLALAGMAYYPDIYFGSNVKALGNALAMPAIEQVWVPQSSVFGSAANHDATRLLMWGDDPTVQVIDAGTGAPLLSLRHADGVLNAKWNADETLILTGSRDGTAIVWDASSGEQKRVLRHPQNVQVSEVYFSTQDRIITVGFDGDDIGAVLVFIWAADTGELLYTQRAPFLATSVLNPEGTRILTGDETTGVIEVRDAQDGTLISVLENDLPLTWMDWSDDGRLVTSDESGVARIWDADKGEELVSVDFGEPAWVTFAPDGQLLKVSLQTSSQISLYDTGTGDWLETVPTVYGYQVSISPDGHWAASWDSVEPGLFLYDLQDGGEGWRLDQSGEISGIAWNDASAQILAWGAIRQEGDDEPLGFVSGWAPVTGVKLFDLQHDSYVSGAAWMDGDSRVLSWTYEDVRVWGLRSHETLALNIIQPVVDWVYSHDRRRVLAYEQVLMETLIQEGTLLLSDANTGETLFRITDTKPIKGYAWSPDEHVILSWPDDIDAEVSAWSGDTGERLYQLPSAPGIVSVVWSPDSSRFVVTRGPYADVEASAAVYAADGKEIATLEDMTSVSFNPLWSSDGTRLLMSEDSGVSIYEAATGKRVVQMLLDEKIFIWDMSWSEDETRVLAWGDQISYLWSAKDGTLLQTFGIPDDTGMADFRQVLWFANGTRLFDDAGRLWDVDTGEMLAQVAAGSVAISPDEAHLVVVSDETASIYDATTADLEFTLEHQSEIQIFPQAAVFYSPDHTRMMTLTWDDTAIIWDAKTGERLLTLSHPGLIQAEWLSDGEVETRSSDGTRRVWPVDVEALLAAARAETVVPLANEDLDAFYLPTQAPTATLMPTASITPQPTLTLSPTIDVSLITPTTGSRRGGQP